MTRSIGLDIGHHAARAVVCTKGREGWVVAGFAQVPRQDASGEPRPLAAVLSELDSRINLRKGALTVSDSARNLLIRFVPTMPLPADRLAKLLRLELAQHAGETGELAADVCAVPLAGDEIIHGAVMAQPEQIRDLLGELTKAGLKPTRIHAGPAALANATLVAPVCQDDQLALVVDIGSSSTRVALVGTEGRLLAFRQLALGGDVFTRAVAEGRGISTDQAEDLKLRWTIGHAFPPKEMPPPEKMATQIAEPGLFLDPDADAAPAAPSVPPREIGTVSRSSAKLFLDEDVPEPGRQTMEIGGATLGPEMTRVAENLYTQLVSTIAWFKSQLQNNDLNPAKVLLCGGSAQLIGLEAYLARRFKLPVDRYDPFAAIAGGPQPGHDYSLALGLALSEEPQAVRLDLLPDGEIRKRLWQSRLVWPYVAAACLVLAGLISGATLLRDQWIHQESLANLQTYSDEYQALDQRLTALEQERQALTDDLRVVAGRIHFNRDLLYVVRVLKERASENQELWVTRLETIPPVLETKPVGTGRSSLAGGGRSTAPATTAGENSVDRGAVEIEGRVKFDIGRKLDAEGLNKFFNDYMKALDASVAGSSGIPLFDPTKTTVFLHWLHEEDTATKPVDPKPTRRQRVSDGSFPFGVRFAFRPYELDQAMTDGGGP
mgnify:CR=1 FL=1